MKFKIKEKDLIIFSIFSIFLFLLIAIAVTNFVGFSNEDSSFTLNPFPAIINNFGLTLLFFILAEVGILTSVSSSVFNKEKGKGIGLKIGEKEEKGYSRWAEEKEIKKYKDVEKVLIKEENATAAGVPLINNGKEMWVDNGENHTLVIGATASGKTTAVVDPLVQSLSKKGESMIVTDPKGEIFKEHSLMLKAKGYKVIVLNFRDPLHGSSWNPLSLPYKLYKEGNKDKAVELVDDVAHNVFIDKKSQADPFWENASADYFAGLALGLFEDATSEDMVNINSINTMCSVGEEKLATSDYAKEYFNLKGVSSTPFVFANATISAPNETKSSILSVFRPKIRNFAAKEDLSEMLAHNDIDMSKIGHEKTAVFIVIHDEKTTYHALATIFIKQCYEALVMAAYNEPSGKLPFKTNFILDEFANMPPLSDVQSMVTAARSRAIRFTFIIQNFAQLDLVYGKEVSETIRSNCGNLIYLLTTELAALEEISKLCGEVKSSDKDKTATKPLISISDLQKLKLNEVVIIKTRLAPFKTQLKPSFQIDWGEKYPEDQYYSREKRPVEIFDLKTFVKEAKRKKLFENLNDDQNKMENNIPSGISSLFENNASQGIDLPKPSGIDINTLTKNIEKRIAELEEEQALKNKNVMNNESKESAILEPKESVILEPKEPVLKTIQVKEEPELVIMDKPKEEVKIETEKPVVNIDNDSVIVNDNVVTDDQFFDDFFGDD